MKLIIILSLLIFVFSGCNKENKKEYAISGKILQGCTNQPVANKEVILYQLISSNWTLQTSGGEVGKTTTDANGNFSLKYKSKNSNELRLQVSAGFGFSTIMERIPSEKDIIDFVIHDRATTTIQVKLNVGNFYTSNDTLLISDYRNLAVRLKVPGPFQNGVLYSAPNYEVMNYYVPVNYQFPLQYRINNGSWVFKDFQLIGCDTTKVIVDIN